jgi:RNA polymerase sigma factor (sigma-70 family)
MLARMGAQPVAPRRLSASSVALPRMASDQRLVDEVHAGSERAFEVLFNRHRRPLLAFCGHLLDSREEAEDAVQQTFLSAYVEMTRGERPRAVRPWLFAIARHRCHAVLRGRGRPSYEAPPESGADQLLAQVATRDDLRAILADVKRLPDDQRAALVLAELGDLSHAEIASIVGCPREKVKALVFQARSALGARRAAREISCADVHRQLTKARGPALRRMVVRRHLQDCASCRAFCDKLRHERRRLGLLLPVPWLLKRTVLGTLLGSGGGAAGAGMTAGALGGVGVMVALAVSNTAGHDGQRARDAREPQRVALATPTRRTAAPPASPTTPADTEPAATRRLSEGRRAIPHGDERRRPEPVLHGRPKSAAPPATPEPPRAHEQPVQSKSAAPAEQQRATESPETSADERPVKPARPIPTPQPSRRATPAPPPRPDRPPPPAKPPEANGRPAPGKPANAPGAPPPSAQPAGGPPVGIPEPARASGSNAGAPHTVGPPTAPANSALDGDGHGRPTG